jgi:hypothetical protein
LQTGNAQPNKDNTSDNSNDTKKKHLNKHDAQQILRPGRLAQQIYPPNTKQRWRIFHHRGEKKKCSTHLRPLGVAGPEPMTDPRRDDSDPRRAVDTESDDIVGPAGAGLGDPPLVTDDILLVLLFFFFFPCRRDFFFFFFFFM